MSVEPGIAKILQSISEGPELDSFNVTRLHNDGNIAYQIKVRQTGWERMAPFVYLEPSSVDGIHELYDALFDITFELLVKMLKRQASLF